MADYQASMRNTPYLRHFMTARQHAQSAYDLKNLHQLAFALRELADGLTGLALDVSIVKQMAGDLVARK